MKTSHAVLCASLVALRALAQTASVTLPQVTVDSTRIANESPAGTFAMPVSGLRYEPLVDLQTRLLAESQSDVTLRGNIFENTGFRLGAVSQSDPQTGHYLAEIPVAPAMLTSPAVVFGAGHAISSLNSTVGAVAFGWRPIRTAGSLTLGFGENHLDREELYQGFASDAFFAGQRVAADVAVAHSASDGAIANGEHRFNRANARLQLAGKHSQTDAYVGYQAKFFGWPNLYTPFNSNETENLQTLLYGLNHRTQFDGGDFVEAGVYHRRNKDDYAFNRFAPVGAVHPFQHTTRETGAAVGGRVSSGDFATELRGEAMSDDLRSTSLTFGPYHTRTLTKLAAIPSYAWTLADRSRFSVRAGATYDHSNRDSNAVSPVVELARDWSTGELRRTYLSYAESTQVASYTALKSNPAAGLFRGNPALGREASRNLELGAQGLVADWTAQAAVFYRRDDALVDWTFRRGVTARTANAVDLDVFGAEAVVRRSWKSLDLVFGYTALSKRADYRGAVVDASFYALNYPRHRLTAAIVARLPGGFELRMDNLARIQAANLLRTAGGESAVSSSLALVYRPSALRGMSFTIQADNLWNSSFQEIPSVPATPRLFSAGVTYAW